MRVVAKVEVGVAARLVFALVHLVGFAVVYIMKCVCAVVDVGGRSTAPAASTDLTEEVDDNKKIRFGCNL